MTKKGRSTYIALIGDLVNSRGIEDRIKTDRRLSQRMSAINTDRMQDGALLSKYTLIGDEIQAIYGSATHMLQDAFSLLGGIYPYKMRFAWGIGQLIKPINRERAIETDGPAFHMARVGIAKLKENEDLFYLSSEDHVPDIILANTVLSLTSSDIKKWKENRFAVFNLLSEGKDYKEISALLGISNNAVYKNIDDGNLDTLQTLVNLIESKINSLWGLKDG